MSWKHRQEGLLCQDQEDVGDQEGRAAEAPEEWADHADRAEWADRRAAEDRGRRHHRRDTAGAAVIDGAAVCRAALCMYWGQAE